MSSSTELNRVAMWLRVSNADQDVENQRLAQARYCEQNGYRVVKEYVADGISAWKGDHLDLLNQALDAAKRGEFDYLMCWSIDRLTRQGAEEALRIVREFSEAGVRVISIQELWLSGDEDQREMMLAMSGVTARIESARRSERNRAASLRMIASNIWGQGRPPLGYRRGEDGRLQVVEEEAETVQLIYDSYDQNRIGYRGVQKALTRRGTLTRNGSTFWSPASVEKILKNPVYTGRHRLGVAAPRIIEQDQWDRVQQKRQSNHRLKPSKPGYRFALQGRARCECGAPIRVERPLKGRGRPVYYCKDRYIESYRVMKSGTKCDVPRRRVEEVEKALMDELHLIMDDPDRFMPVLQNSIDRLMAELESMTGGAASLQSQLDSVRDQLERLEISWIDGRISNETRVRMRSPLENESRELEESLARTSPEARTAVEEKQQLLKGAMEFLRNAEMRQNSGMRIWQFTFDPDFAESDDLHRYRMSSEYPVAIQKGSGAEKLDRLLTDLQAEIVFHHDCIELVGAVKLSMPDVEVGTAHPHASITGGS